MSKDDLVLGHGASRPLSTKELEASIDRVFKKAIDWKDRAEKAEARIAEVESAGRAFAEEARTFAMRAESAERERKTAIDLFQHEQDRAEKAEARIAEVEREMAQGKLIAEDAAATAGRAITRAESAERRASELRRAYDEYVALLNEEIGNLVGLATIHGWKSDLVEAGKAARAKIAALAAGEG